MKRILKNYLFWAYPRGSFHYDVMVTLILAFIFLSPHMINYRERPQGNLASASQVLVKTDGADALTYEIGANQVKNSADETRLKAELLKQIQAISGNVEMDRYIVRKDASGRVTAYRVWAHR